MISQEILVRNPSIDEVRRYAAKNQKKEKDDPIHAAMIDEIAGNLSEYGIQNPSEVYREVMLIEKGLEIGRTDLVVISPPIVYLIEGKVARNKTPNTESLERIADEINGQLKKSYLFYHKHFNIHSVLIASLKRTPSSSILHRYKRM